jgi:hypothetical protein
MVDLIFGELKAEDVTPGTVIYPFEGDRYRDTGCKVTEVRPLRGFTIIYFENPRSSVGKFRDSKILLLGEKVRIAAS